MLTGLLLMFTLHAADDLNIQLESPKLSCRVQTFIGKDKKTLTACEGLADSAEVDIASLVSCKTRAAEKARACLKKAAAEQLTVRGRFAEKFKIRSNSTTFNCQLDSSGGNSCI